MRPLSEGVELCVFGTAEAASFPGAPAGGEGDFLHTRAAFWLLETYGIRWVATLIFAGEKGPGRHVAGFVIRRNRAGVQPHPCAKCGGPDWGGDCFPGPLPRVRTAGRGAQECAEFATATALWKHTVPADGMRERWSDIEALAGGAGGAVVKR